MGGTGSGRRTQFGARTTEECNSIDIRWLKREGAFRLGIPFRVTWSRGDMLTGSVEIRAEPHHVVLEHSHLRGGRSDGQTQRYPVQLETTPCHVGGERLWFRCPSPGCGRRVAILYGGPSFACRHCHKLVYPSQNEKPWERAARLANRLRVKLDWPGGIFEGAGWEKPKGMHWDTYHRLCEQYDELSDRALGGLIGYLDRTSDGP